MTVPSPAELTQTCLEEHFGESDGVLHELASDGLHIDIHLIPATRARPYRIAYTTGMSAHSMNAPDGESTRAELMIALLPGWNVRSQDAMWTWPFDVMRYVARIPWAYDSWIGYGHTIPNGDPPAPFHPAAAFVSAIVAPPLTLPPELHTHRLANGESLTIWALGWLTPAELELKLAEGADAVFDQWDGAGVSEVLDPRRT